MALAEAFVEIVADPKRFNQAWRRLQQQVRGFTITVDVTADTAEFAAQVRAAEEALPTADVPVTADTSAMASDVAAAAAMLPDIPVDADTRRMQAEIAAAARAVPDPTITPHVNTGPMIAQLSAAGAAAGGASSSGFLGAFALGLGGLTVATGAVAGAIGAFGLQSAASIEQIAVAFNSLTGSAEEGQKTLESLQKFAATTPFEFEDVAVAARRLLAMGQAAGIARSELQPVLTTIGNVASVTGGGAQALDSVTLAMGQMASSGKITLENLNQISEAMPGFSGVAAIAAATGKTTAQVMEEISAGEINAKAGIDALLKGMQQFPGAAGAMEAQSQTLIGVFSTFKDTLSQTLAGAFAPVIPEIKEALTAVTPVLNEALGQLAPVIGEAMSKLLPFIGQLIQGLTPIFGPLIAGLSSALSAIGPALAPLGSTIGTLLTAFGPLLTLVGQIVAALAEGLSPVIASLAPLASALAGALSSALTPLLPLIVQIGGVLAQSLVPVIGLLADLFKQLAPFIAQAVAQFAENLQPLLDVLPGLVLELVNALLPLLPAIVALAGPLADLIAANAPLIILLAELLTIIVKILAPVIQFGAEIIKWLAVEALGPLLQIIADNLTGVSTSLKPVIDLFTGLIGLLTSFDWGSIGETIATAFSDALTSVTTFFTDIGGFLAALPQQALQYLGQFGTTLVNAFTNAFTNAKNTAFSIINQIMGAIGSIPERIGAFTGRLFEAGKNLILGFAKGLRSVGGFVADVAGDIVGSIKGFLNNVIRKLNDGIAGLDNVLPFSLPRLGLLAKGGLALGPSLVAETGRPELAIPLEDPRAQAAVRQALGDSVGGGIVFEPGAINMTFGGVPTAAEAVAAGRAVGNGIASVLARRNTRLAIRRR